MKIWSGYGSEHSMSLVMIGHFKTEEDAEKVEAMINRLTSELREKIDIGSHRERYGREVRDLLHDIGCYSVSPVELEHFLYDFDTSVEENKLILKTDESDVSAFFKLMIDNEAKVEIYSTHFFPDEGE